MTQKNALFQLKGVSFIPWPGLVQQRKGYAMDLLNASKISGTALAAHRHKLNVIGERLANVDTKRS